MIKTNSKNRQFDWASWVFNELKLGNRINMEIHGKIYVCEVGGFTPEIKDINGEFLGWFPILLPINHNNSIPYIDQGTWVSYKAFVPTVDDLEQSFILNKENLKNIERYKINKAS